MEFNQLTAAILAGGLGTRLRSVIQDSPKVLARVRRRHFLEYLLDQLAAVGTKRIVLCTGYMGEKILEIIGKSYSKMEIVYSQESSPLGTGGALRLAMPLIKSDPVFVMNGDSFCDVDFKKMLNYHCAVDAEATIALVEVYDTSRFGSVHVDSDGLVIGFEEKSEKIGSGWINAGIYFMNCSILENIPVNSTVSLEREVFPAWIGRGLYGFRSKCNFLDIGTPESYALADDFFRAQGDKKL
jgi:NDP-sugar pyrophosphorylase family protein